MVFHFGNREKDPEVRKLADGIIEAQKKEIAEMKAMLKRLKKK